MGESGGDEIKFGVLGAAAIVEKALMADGRRRIEAPPHTSSYDHQLSAFVAAALDGRPFPTTVDDAVANMSVIDDLYRAAGLEPRVPTPA